MLAPRQQQPQSVAAIAGTTVGFTVQALGTSPLVFSWRKDSKPLKAANSASLTLSNVQPANGGAYSVVVSNASGVVTSAVANLMVVVPPQITKQPAGKTVKPGKSFKLSVKAKSNAPLTYQWFLKGAPVDGAIGSSLTIASVGPANVGDYWVVVTSGSVTATSAIARLELVPPKLAPLAANSKRLSQDSPFSLIPLTQSDALKPMEFLNRQQKSSLDPMFSW